MPAQFAIHMLESVVCVIMMPRPVSGHYLHHVYPVPARYARRKSQLLAMGKIHFKSRSLSQL